jgi:hypothetical protein
MAKKKKVTEPIPTVKEPLKTDEELPQVPKVEPVTDNGIEQITVSTPGLIIEPQTVSTPAVADKMVRVRNQGKPFLCDLTSYGYGMRWPTNAVYTIPASVYMKLLDTGLDGVSA